jgi:hypothetical protein
VVGLSQRAIGKAKEEIWEITKTRVWSPRAVLIKLKTKPRKLKAESEKVADIKDKASGQSTKIMGTTTTLRWETWRRPPGSQHHYGRGC